MNIRVFYHREPNLINGDIAQITEQAAATILNRIENSSPNITLTISPKELDDRAQFHADKWVEETALHMQQYSDAPSSLSERTLLEGDKGRQTTTLTKMYPKRVHQNRITGLHKTLLGWDTSPFGPEAHWVRAGQLALADQQGMQPFQVEANTDQVPFTGGLE